MTPLAGRVAVVTGASRGLGRAIARALAEAGADIAVAARSKPDLEETAHLVEAAGRRALVAPTDVTSYPAVEALMRSAATTLGRLDIVVNNAGVGRGPVDPNMPSSAPGSVGLEAMSAARWDEYLAQNLRTTFVTTA